MKTKLKAALSLAAPRFYLYDYLLEAGKQTGGRVAMVLGAM